MTIEQVSYFVETQHAITYVPDITEVTTTRGIFHGFFQPFDDYESLKENNKWRFVPTAKFVLFQGLGVENGKEQTSIIIDGDTIAENGIQLIYPDSEAT